MAILSNEHAKFVDEYFRIMEEARQAHEASVKAIIAKKKARKKLLQDMFLYSVVGIIGLMISAIVITLVIFAFKP